MGRVETTDPHSADYPLTTDPLSVDVLCMDSPPPQTTPLSHGLPLLKSTKITRYNKCTWEITFSRHIGYCYFFGPIPPSSASLSVNGMVTTELNHYTVGI